MGDKEKAELLSAARNGDLIKLTSDKVTDLLSDDDGCTCTHYAARGGSLEALQYLVTTRGLNPTKRNSVGATSLHDAAAMGNLRALKWLLDQPDTKVDDQDDSGATVTHLSAGYGHIETLTWLLDETNCDILKKSSSGALPLHFAAERGHLECVRILLEEAPRSSNMQMNNGSTPVYLACQMGHLEVAQFLASKNGTPKIHTFDGMSPLHAAAQTGKLQVVKWLIQDQGLNPNERDFDGTTPLHYAASKGHSHVIEWLIKEGGARIILDNLGGSPLHSAAQLGQNKVILTLLQNGCDKDITDNQGLTAAELAEKCDNKTAVDILRGELTDLPDHSTDKRTHFVPQYPNPADLLTSTGHSPALTHYNRIQSTKSTENIPQNNSWYQATEIEKESSEVLRSNKQDKEVRKITSPSEPEVSVSRRNISRVQVGQSRNFGLKSDMEDTESGSVTMNGDGPVSLSSEDSQSNNGLAKSVITINNKDVTIVSTRSSRRSSAKIVTTPLRMKEDHLVTGSVVSSRKKDAEFISTLSQRFSTNGTSSKLQLGTSSVSSVSSKLSSGSASSSSTPPLSQPKQITSEAQKKQQVPDDVVLPIQPSVMSMNGHVEHSKPEIVIENNHSNLPIPMPPPPPPPPPPDFTTSNGYKVADAKYSSSVQNSSVQNGSGSTPELYKHNLMAAIHAAVTSGTPSSNLRKTPGPNSGGLKEVQVAKKSASSLQSSAESQKLPVPTFTCAADDFDPKNFLDKVPKVDSTGKMIPDWKRQMLAKGLSQKAQAEYLERKKVEEYEARFKNVPAWKRAIIEKKEASFK